jgi:osmotically-inducible protein OsmY
MQDVETAIVMQLGASLLRELPGEVTLIDVRCQPDAVTQVGQVDSQARRDMAEQVARQYPGVLTIGNNLEMFSPASPDSPNSGTAKP